MNILPFRINSLPTISALKFNGALTMAVGTSTGQVSMFKLETSLKFLFQRCVCVVGNINRSFTVGTENEALLFWPEGRVYSRMLYYFRTLRNSDSGLSSWSEKLLSCSHSGMCLKCSLSLFFF